MKRAARLFPMLLLALALWPSIAAAQGHEDKIFAAFHGPELHSAEESGDPASAAMLFENLPIPRAADSSSEFPVPSRLRPCCAFGQGLGLQVVFVPVPGFRLDNVLEADRLGRHRYDSGMVGLRNGVRRVFLSEERNGLVYTRRGGFVDLAHVRAYADWTVFLAQRVAALLPGGGLVELPDEGGRRMVVVEPVDPDWVERNGRERIAIVVAQWLSYQISVWHEAATWFGWSSTPVFPERVSAFSPEDLYSNLLGAQLASSLLREGAARSERQYERNMDSALPEVLRRLGAVSQECSRVAAKSVDGFWWDSERRLPNTDVVTRRNFALGPALVPWRVALPSGHEPALAAGSESLPQRPAVLHLQDHVAERPVRELARLSIEVSPNLAKAFPFDREGQRWIDQDQLSRVIERIRRQASSL